MRKYKVYTVAIYNRTSEYLTVEYQTAISIEQAISYHNYLKGYANAEEAIRKIIDDVISNMPAVYDYDGSISPPKYINPIYFHDLVIHCQLRECPRVVSLQND